MNLLPNYLRTSPFSAIRYQLQILLALAIQIVPLLSFSQKKINSAKDIHFSSSFFIENKGQWPNEVLFMTQQDGMNAWITKHGITYDLYRITNETTENNSNASKGRVRSTREQQVVQLTYEGIKEITKLEFNKETEGKHNYLVGPDESKWVRDVSLYEEVILKDVYSGIDQKYYFDDKSVRYDFIAKEGADVTSIRMKIEGSDKSMINKEGDLVMVTRLGELKQAKLFTYQIVDGKKVKVESKFSSKPNGDFGFDIGNYDKSRPLIIDPIIWSTYMCGDNLDNTQSMAVNEYGEVFIAGGTWSSSFPTYLGYSNVFNGGWADGFVSKLKSDGTSLIYSTFLGSTGWDWMRGIDVNKDGYAFVIGESNSLTYPCTAPGAFSSTLAGGNPQFNDVVVTVLNAQGNGLLYSSYIGSTDYDFAGAIKVAPNSSNIFYICGQTNFGNFPTTGGTLFPTYQGLCDGFICRMDRTIPGTGSLTNSTFFGGSNGGDWVRGMTVDLSNNVYVTGETSATNFPVSSTFGTGFISSNVFASKVNSTLSTSLYSVIIQGDGIDAGTDIEINSGGEAYVTGYAGYSNFYTNTGVGWAGGPSDMFLAKLNSTGTICDSKFIGGNDEDKAYGLQLFGNKVYIAGYSTSINFPTTLATAFSTTLNGSQGDAVIVAYDADLSILTPRYGTYVGGGLYDMANAIYVDMYENIYIAGQTGSFNYPVTPSAFQTVSGGTFDGFVTKLNPKCGNITNSKYYLNPKTSVDFPSGILPTTPVILDGNFWVNQNTSILNNPNVYFTPNAMVGVDPNVTLTINTSELKACNDMWDGVYENGNNQNVVISNSVLNDMINGINVQGNSKINCTNSTFSNNYKSFSFKKLITTANCVIENNIIQKSGTGLKAPYLNQKPYYGMYLEDCYNINIGNLGSASSFNTLKDMRCGIRLEYTSSFSSPLTLNPNINIYNNKFKDINEQSIDLNANSILGCGIYASNALSTKNITVNVEGHQLASFNHFDNCDKGILFSRTSGKVKYNKMVNTVLGAFMLNCIGRNYDVRNNTLLNTQLGICKIGDEGPLGTKVSGNTITLSTFNNVLSNPTATGIKSIYSSTVHVGKTYIDNAVSPNIINVPMSDYGIGVSMENGNGDVVGYNQIHLLASTGSSISAIPKLLGIYSNKSERLIIENNLVDNNYSINGNVQYIPGNNAGIYVNSNANVILKCNMTNYMRWGIFATGINGSTTNYNNVVGNNMNASSADMMFWQTGTAPTLGLVGKYDAINKYDADNTFLNNPSLNKVFRMNSSSTPSVCSQIPGSEGITTLQSKLSAIGSTLYPNGESTALTNSPGCKYPLNNPPGSFTTTYSGCSMPNVIDPNGGGTIDINLANLIATIGLNYDSTLAEGAQRADEEMLYAWLAEHVEIRNEYSVLNDFYLERYAEMVGNLYSIDVAIAGLSDDVLMENDSLWTASLEDVTTLNDALEPEDFFDANAKEINRLYLKTIANDYDVLTEEDRGFIQTLAGSCPLTHGSAVYRARVLQGIVSPETHYDDIEICNNQGVLKGGLTTLQEQLNLLEQLEQKAQLANNDIVVYPIPASNTINIEYKLPENETGMFYIYDVLGTKITEQKVYGTVTKAMLNVSTLAKGFYTYKMIGAKNITYTGKIIIE